MKKLKYIAFRGKSITSKLIRFYTRSQDYSHIAVMVSDNLLIEAWNHSKNPLKQWIDYSNFTRHTNGTKYEIWELEVSDDVYDYCMSEYNKMAKNKIKYDWKSILGFVLKLKKDKSNRMMCSEMAITPLAKIFKWDKTKPHMISPERFVCEIQIAGAKKIKEDIVRS